MGSWDALDVAIGLAVTYFVLSLLASTLTEAIASVFGWRATYLERWLLNAFEDPEKLKEFWEHPLVKPLLTQPRLWNANKTGPRKPSYIANGTFVSVLMNFQATALAAEHDAKAAVKALPTPALQKVGAALHREGDDLEALRHHLEHWYDDSMERVSGWYKRRTQLALAVIGLATALLLNADTLRIGQTLWTSKAVRAAVVAEAGRITQQGSSSPDLTGAAAQVQKIKALDVPLGWNLSKGDPRDLPHGARLWIAKLLGILLTTLAIMLGASFWFDLLSKMMRLRGGGAPPPATGAVRSGEGEQKRPGPGAAPA